MPESNTDLCQPRVAGDRSVLCDGRCDGREVLSTHSASAVGPPMRTRTPYQQDGLMLRIVVIVVAVVEALWWLW